jgi:hypothetical protein
VTFAQQIAADLIGHRTRAMLRQDGYAEACRRLDNARVATRWAQEDGLDLTPFHDAEAAAMAAWESAWDAFRTLTQAEHDSIGLRTPITL